MTSKKEVWEKIRGRVKAILHKKKRKEQTRGRQKILRSVLTRKQTDLKQRLERLHLSYKRGLITKKQYRRAKRLIIDAYE